MSTIFSKEDLNDFIAPGVACIKPVEVLRTQDHAEIQIGEDGRPMEVTPEGTSSLKTAQISLTDCLACSGCVTSSEAMLVELQSPKELLAARNSAAPSTVFVASICPQARASLSASLGLSIESVDAKLRYLFMEKLGFTHVVGTQVGRAISLEMSAAELAQRSEKPVLSSVCPGWTCYVEKTHPHILPYLSQVRSPQQITGRLLKTLLAKQHQLDPQSIFHLSVMPCFDKKLEASREEYALDGAREVDLVITAREVWNMCTEHLELSFADMPEAGPAAPIAGWPGDDWSISGGSASGGYLAYVIARALQLRPDCELRRQDGKNSDVVEYLVEEPGTGTVVFRGAQIYGFRNIQNLVRKLKPGKARVRQTRGPTNPADYNYVELMACPGGCLNGGGQLPLPEGVSSKQWLQQLEQVYRLIQECNVSGPVVADYLQQSGVEIDDALVHATFKPLEPVALPPALAVGTQW